MRMTSAWRPFKTVANASLVLSVHHSVLWDDVIDVVKVPSDKIQKAYHRKHGSLSLVVLYVRAEKRGSGAVPNLRVGAE